MLNVQRSIFNVEKLFNIAEKTERRSKKKILHISGKSFYLRVVYLLFFEANIIRRSDTYILYIV